MGLEIRLTKRAEEDLNEIFSYGALDNPGAAERFARSLLKRIETRKFGCQSPTPLSSLPHPTGLAALSTR